MEVVWWARTGGGEGAGPPNEREREWGVVEIFDDILGRGSKLFH